MLADVVRRLPPGPFTAAEFLDHAIGLNAIGNAADVELLLDQLTESGVIRRADDWLGPRWLAVS